MNVIDQHKLQQSIHYEYHHIMTYNKHFKFVVAERGVGKTYSFKKFCLHQAIKYKYQFIWLRRTAEQVKEVKHKFLGDVRKEFPDMRFQVKGDQIQGKQGKGRWKKLGFIKSLSTVGNIRGAEYEQVRTVVYDEFIVDPKVDRYLDREVLRYFTFIDTVFRLRKGNMIFLGNSESIDNPFFNMLGIKPNIEIGILKGKDWVLELPDCSKYRVARQTSMVGEVVKYLPEYADMSTENKWLDNNANVVDKNLLTCKCNITDLNGTYGVWFTVDGSLHISDKTDPSKTMITFKRNSHNVGITFVNQSSPLMKQLIRRMEKGTLTFSSIQVKNMFVNSVK